jgi:hypothetical protein
MTVQTTIAVPMRQRRAWLVASAALVAASIATVAVVLATGGQRSGGSTSEPAISAQHGPAGSTAAGSIMSLTPARMAAGALGLGYALPSTQHGLTTASVLAAMSPAARAYTEAVMKLTFAQLAAGGAGSP